MAGTNFGGYVNTSDRATSPTQLPLVSEQLNSVRTYGFECRFTPPQFSPDIFEGIVGDNSSFTLAAKQVTNPGFSVEEIAVHRLNDTVYYPGKIKKDELKIVFDDLYSPRISTALFNWFKKIYDPVTGLMAGQASELPRFKGNLDIISLDGNGHPVNITRYYGVWPRVWKGSEFNYSTNDFHNIEVQFAYDFMEQQAS